MGRARRRGRGRDRRRRRALRLRRRRRQRRQLPLRRRHRTGHVRRGRQRRRGRFQRPPRTRTPRGRSQLARPLRRQPRRGRGRRQRGCEGARERPRAQDHQRVGRLVVGHANGLVTLSGKQQSFEETVFLQKLSGTWFVSNQATFQRSFTTPQARQRRRRRPRPARPPAARSRQARAGLRPPRRPRRDDGPQALRLRRQDRRRELVRQLVRPMPARRSPTSRPPRPRSSDQVTFLGVDYLEDPAAAINILDDHKATYPAVLDSEGKVADHYRVNGGLPEPSSWTRMASCAPSHRPGPLDVSRTCSRRPGWNCSPPGG